METFLMIVMITVFILLSLVLPIYVGARIVHGDYERGVRREMRRRRRIEARRFRFSK